MDSSTSEASSDSFSETGSEALSRTFAIFI
jgi:hypothetical protein